MVTHVRSWYSCGAGTITCMTLVLAPVTTVAAAAAAMVGSVLAVVCVFTSLPEASPNLARIRNRQLSSIRVESTNARARTRVRM